MHLAQDNDVVHTLTPDRSDQPFGKAILPRRGKCGRLCPGTHGAQSACNDAAIDAIPIADEVSWSLISMEMPPAVDEQPGLRESQGQSWVDVVAAA